MFFDEASESEDSEYIEPQQPLQHQTPPPSSTLLSKLLDNPEEADKILTGAAHEKVDNDLAQNPDICTECEESSATLFCFQCNDSFCQECFNLYHSKGNRASHQTSTIFTNAEIEKEPAQIPNPPIAFETSHTIQAATPTPIELNMNLPLPSPSPTPSLTPTASTHRAWYERAKYIPIRLTREDRQSMRLVDAVLSTCNYTDLIDNTSFSNASRRIGKIIQELCGILTGLVVSKNYQQGQLLIADRNFANHQHFFQNMFELGRRYKITTPEKMRSSYGKLMYCLMDSQLPAVREMIGFSCVVPVRNVFEWLEHYGISALLDDPLLDLATKEIYATDQKPRHIIDQEIKMKERAVKVLSTRYSRDSPLENNGEIKQDPYSYARNDYYYWGYRPRRRSIDLPPELCNGPDYLPKPLSIKTTADPEDVKWMLYSLADNATFLRFNSEPCRRMLEYLDFYFDPNEANKEVVLEDTESEDEHTPNSPSDDLADPAMLKDPQHSDPSQIFRKGDLSIEVGYQGARLRHDHTRQFHYVKQTLTLWEAILKEMFKLWSLAEQDLLDPHHPYQMKDTGQGIQRLQMCSRVGKEMARILRSVQAELTEGWVGSSVIHLGDTNVPNAFLFVDKYTQVSRILSPLVIVLDKVPAMCRENEGTKLYVEKEFGSVRLCQLEILQDFFRSAFDGSGSDSFFEAGSCIDGRLTSAWNWCSKLEQKRFFPVFLLAGFTGFDGQF
ncbi:putative UPF0652 like protein [Blattamonas nauphoetae]|uniref:UPF0652 like protein n=1 Tax=Blattamonas nauphoetae TaxID=2049346 RepID=A0ABQ9XNU9_9EUKA|nr:putative UPF0652 like protein [Blattamonas nauphoetae]